MFRHLYDRDHLDQVVATFGIILFLNQGVKIVWGAAPLSLPIPDLFSGTVVLMPGLVYPMWRLVIIACGLATAALLYVMIRFTRVGMLVRAGATDSTMVSALGVDIRRLFMIVFGFGTMLAGFAGVMIAPILSVEPGMGDAIVILAFVVIVIGGIGSIRGAFLGAMLVGLVDTLGRSFVVDILRLFMAPSPARTVGPAIASMLIYLLMAVVLSAPRADHGVSRSAAVGEPARDDDEPPASGDDGMGQVPEKRWGSAGSTAPLPDDTYALIEEQDDAEGRRHPLVEVVAVVEMAEHREFSRTVQRRARRGREPEHHQNLRHPVERHGEIRAVSCAP